MNQSSDWDLIARAQEGDDDAFADLVRRHQRPVVHFCQRMLGSREDAEDVAQESFIRVYRYLHRLKPEAKFSTALFGIARNLTLNFIRDAKRRGRGVTYSMTREDESERLVQDESKRPDREARTREVEAMIEKCMQMISPEHREVLLLRNVMGLDYEAIAKTLKCRKGTVKSRLARAREQLRAKVAEVAGDVL